MSLLDLGDEEEEGDYERLMRLLEDDANQEQDQDQDQEQGQDLDVPPELDLDLDLDLSLEEGSGVSEGVACGASLDVFQQLDASCLASTVSEGVSEVVSPPTLLNGNRVVDDSTDTLPGTVRERQRSTDSIPDGVSLEWEESDKGSVDRQSSSRSHSFEYDRGRSLSTSSRIESGPSDSVTNPINNNEEDEEVEGDGDTCRSFKWTDDVLDFDSPLTHEVLAELDGARYLSLGNNAFDFHLGLRKINVALHDQAFTFTLRPDVAADSVFSLIEQIMLSFGSKCLATLPAHVHRELLFQPTHPNSSCWQEIQVHLGVNSSKRRVLVVVLKPSDMSQRGLISSGLGIAASWSGMGLSGGISAGGGSCTVGFETLVKDLEACFTESLHGEQFTYGHLLQQLKRAQAGSGGLLSLGTLAERQIQQLPATTSEVNSLLPPLDSLLDPNFVRDLQESFLREVKNRLTTLTSSNLNTVADLERQCARLMTLLRPFYARCAINPLTPPTKSQAFTNFMSEINTKFGLDRGTGDTAPSTATMVSSSSSIGACVSSGDITIQQATLETAKLLILRARRTYIREQREDSLNGFASQSNFNVDAHSKHSLEVQGVLHLIYLQLREMCEVYANEYANTLKALIAIRSEHIEKFRWQLIQALAKRDIHTSEDKEMWKLFKDKFRVADEAYPFIVDFRATMSSMLTDTGVSSSAGGTMSNNNRSGTVFITLRDIYFTSNHIPLMGVVQKIIPISIVKSFTTTDATLLSNGTLSIIDSGGNTTTFWISSPAPNYASRVGDLLHLLMTTGAGSGTGSHASTNGMDGAPITQKAKERLSTPKQLLNSTSNTCDESLRSPQEEIVQAKRSPTTLANDLLSLTMEPVKQTCIPQKPLVDSSFEDSMEAAIARSLQATSSVPRKEPKQDPFASLTKNMFEQSNSLKTAPHDNISSKEPVATAPVPTPAASGNKMALGIQAFLDQQRKQGTKK